MCDEHPPPINLEDYPGPPPQEESTQDGSQEESVLTKADVESATHLDGHEECSEKCSLLELVIEAEGGSSTSFRVRDHAEVASDDESRFCLAPTKEKLKLHWKIETPASAVEGKIELFRYDSSSPIWTKKLETEELQGMVPIDWDGDLGSDGGGLFPDSVPTAEHSPYLMKMTIEGNVKEDFETAWTFFDVTIVEVELLWGEDDMIPTERSDEGMSSERKISILEEEKEILAALKDAKTEGPLALDEDAFFNVALKSNIFSTDSRQWNDDTFFQEYKKLWGEGPGIPIVIVPKIQHSNKEDAVEAPAAVGRVQFLWDCRDPKPEKNRDEVDDAEFGKLLDLRKDEYDNAQKGSTNCPVDRGGKHGSKEERVLPLQPGTAGSEEGKFPFKITAVKGRPWASLSEARAGGSADDAFKGRSGVLFQPSRMAGDTYELAVYVAKQCAKTLAGSPLSDLEAEGLTPLAESGSFEVWRQMDVLRYIVKSDDQDKADFKEIAKTFTKAGIVLNVPDAATVIADDKYNAAYQAAYVEIQIGSDTKEQRELPFMAPRTRDHSATATAALLNCRSYFDVVSEALVEAVEQLKDSKGLGDVAAKLATEKFKPAWKYIGSLISEKDLPEVVGTANASLNEITGGLFSHELSSANFKKAQSLLVTTGVYSKNLTKTDNFVSTLLTEGCDVDLGEDEGAVILHCDGKSEFYPPLEGIGLGLTEKIGLAVVYSPTVRLSSELGKRTSKGKWSRRFVFLPIRKGETELPDDLEDYANLIALNLLLPKNKREVLDGDEVLVQVQDQGHFEAIKDYLTAALTPEIGLETHDGSKRQVAMRAYPGDPAEYPPYLEEGIGFRMLGSSTSLNKAQKLIIRGFVDKAVERATHAPIQLVVAHKGGTSGTNRGTTVKTHIEEILTERREAIIIELEDPPPSYTMTPLVAHEIGHTCFIPHAEGGDATGYKPYRHTKDYSCLMNYVPDIEEFCGICNIALRGWDIGTEKLSKVATMNVTPETEILLLPTPGIRSRRVRVHIQCRAGADFNGWGELEMNNDNLALYSTEEGGESIGDSREIVFIDHQALLRGIDFWAEGRAPGSTEIQVEVGGKKDKAKITTVRASMELYGPQVHVPDPEHEDQQILENPRIERAAQRTTGAVVRLQHDDNSRKRAKLVVKVEPATAGGNLVLKQIATGEGKIALNKGETKRQANLMAGDEYALKKEAEQIFWLEGTSLSEDLADVKLELTLESDPEQIVEYAFLTVDRFELLADLPVTPPKTKREMSGGRKDSPYTWTDYKTPLPDNLPTRQRYLAESASTQFDTNVPLVLLAGSAPSPAPVPSDPSTSDLVEPVKLTVSLGVAFKDSPVVWQALRSAEDHDSIESEGEKPLPTLEEGESSHEAVLHLDAVGSFHLRAFVDLDGSGTFDAKAPKPNMVLNLVLVKASLVENKTAITGEFCACDPFKKDLNMHSHGSTAQGFAYKDDSHPELGGNDVPIHMWGVVKLIGGGADGKLGLNRVFGGWVNNVLTDEAIGEYRGEGDATGRGETRYLQERAGAVEAVDHGEDHPLLDKALFARYPSGGQICLSTSLPRRTLLESGSDEDVGINVDVHCLDAPGTGWELVHPGVETLKLRSQSMKVDFLASLCLWTSRGRYEGNGKPEDVEADAGSLLYGTILQVWWTVEGSYNIDEEGTVTPVQALTTFATKPAVEHAQLEPAVNAGFEVRPPTGLMLQTPRDVTSGGDGEAWPQ